MNEFYEGNEFTDRIRCRSREKEDCLELVEKMIRYGLIYQTGGAEYLARELKFIDDSYLKLAIELLLEDTESSELQSILSRHILAGNYHGKEFLEKMVILEGVQAIQYRLNIFILAEILLSLFGEDYLVENKPDNFVESLIDSVGRITDFYMKIRELEKPDPEKVNIIPKEFRKLLQCDAKGIQKIIREVDSIFIVRAIKNIDLNFKKVIYESVTDRTAKILFEKENKEIFTQEEEFEARSRILFILNKLIQSGEITLEGSEYGLFL